MPSVAAASPVAQRPLEAGEQRLTSALQSLENVLRDDAQSFGDTRRLVTWLTVRRTFARHVWLVCTPNTPDSPAAFARTLDSARISTGAIVQFVSQESPADPIDAAIVLLGSADPSRIADIRVPQGIPPCYVRQTESGHWQVVGGSAGAGNWEQVVEIIASDRAYAARYRARSVLGAQGLVASLRLHLRLVRHANQARKELLSRQSVRLSSATNGDKGALDVLQLQIADSFQELSRRINEGIRRGLKTESGIGARMDGEIDRIGPDDLARESARNLIRISLSREVQNDLVTAMRRHVENDIDGMVDDVNATLERVEVLIGRFCSITGQTMRSTESFRLQSEPLLDRVSDLIQMSVRYRGTMPKRGFLQRLSEGRRIILAVTMFASMFGSFVGFNWRRVAVIGWIFLIGFLVSVFYSYRAWKEEDREKINEELDKARDQLRMEIRRVLGEIYRELQTTFSEATDGVRRSIAGVMDELGRVAVAQQQRDNQMARDSTQLAVRQIESREQQLTSPLNALTRIDTELQALRTVVAA